VLALQLPSRVIDPLRNTYQ